jgi:hypothetical protein
MSVVDLFRKAYWKWAARRDPKKVEALVGQNVRREGRCYIESTKGRSHDCIYQVLANHASTHFPDSSLTYTPFSLQSSHGSLFVV